MQRPLGQLGDHVIGNARHASAHRLRKRIHRRPRLLGLLEETITAEEPVAAAAEAGQAKALVDAISRALNAGVTRIADRVVARLSEEKPHATN